MHLLKKSMRVKAEEEGGLPVATLGMNKLKGPVNPDLAYCCGIQT